MPARPAAAGALAAFAAAEARIDELARRADADLPVRRPGWVARWRTQWQAIAAARRRRRFAATIARLERAFERGQLHALSTAALLAVLGERLARLGASAV